MRRVGVDRFAWYPSEEVRRSANWSEFLHFVALSDYAVLEQKARDAPEWFWASVIAYLDVKWETNYERVRDLDAGKPWPRWCVGGRTNLALSTIDRWAGSEKAALIWEDEEGGFGSLSYSELLAEVDRLAHGLVSLEVREGECVGVFMPLGPEAVVAFLALAKVGAVVVPLFSGFGVGALASRLADAETSVVITADDIRRRGRPLDLRGTMLRAVASVPSVRHIVVAHRRADMALADREVDWDELVRDQPAGFRSAAMEAEAPLMIMYTSGTAGQPKGTVHTHIGLLVKTGLDFVLGFDLKPSDILLWPTDFGWLVGPIQITAVLQVGATLVLMDGAPDYPQRDRLLQLVARHRVSFLGIGPTLGRLMKRYGDEGLRNHDLSSLRVAASTGEPWDPETWRWVFEKICGSRAPLMNYSGGTELGGLISTNVLYPIKPCGFHGPIPGTDADIVDDEGRSVPRGAVGELVMRSPTLGMTKGLWKDPERYLETYWSQIPGMWVQGDWASRDEDGVWFIHGRSDDTIKLAGKRTGPAEIEAAVMATGLVAEAAAVGVPDPLKGQAIVVAIVPLAELTTEVDLVETVCAAVVEALGRPFRPARVIVVPELPKTRNGKLVRRAVRSVLSAADPGDLSGLANPEVLDEIRRQMAVPPLPFGGTDGE